MQKVAIIGFGKLGQALANVLEARKGNIQISAWDVVATNDPRQVPTLAESTQNASTLFFSVPSKHFKQCLSQLGQLDQSVFLVSLTKGIDPDSEKLPFELMTLAYPQNPIGVISGPMLSEELEKRLPTKAALASHQKEQVKEIIDLFKGTSLSLEESDDLVGVSLLGILKNVYCLALGLSDGLNLGSNFKSCLVLLSFREMAAIVEENGGRAETITTFAGLPDFITTGYSQKSRNYTYGFKKARGEDLGGIMAEGADNIENVIGKAANLSQYPLLKVIKEVFIQNQDPKVIVRLIA